MMAAVDLEERATAAQMLVKVCNGEGLSSKPWTIPQLPISQSNRNEGIAPEQRT